MRYKNFTLVAIFIFLCLNTKVKGQFSQIEPIFTVQFSPFLEKIHSLKDYNGNIFLHGTSRLIPSEATDFAYNGQELIKDQGQIYLFLLQTGIVYKMDTPSKDSVVFRRMDNTININYNIDCLNFVYKNQIYNYGGYGFWTKYPYIRKFNNVDKEWDIVTTNLDIYNADYEWYSKAEGRLYVPLQKLENKSLKGEEFKDGIYDYAAYYLDMPSTNWIKLGKTSKEFIKLINGKNNYQSILHDNGRIFLINDEAYFLDYSHNKIYKSKRADYNQFFIRNSSSSGAFFYKGKFYKYLEANKDFKTWDFNLIDFEVLDYPIWNNDNTLLFYLLYSLVAVVFIIFLIVFIKKTIRNKIHKAQFKTLKIKSINQAFSEIEIGLIQLMLNAFVEKKNVEITEINRVLGIKDKNIGLQKKVRSDVMNSINDKYIILSQNEINLISSIRKEDDKRFFEYFITPSEIKSIQKMIEKS